MVRRPEGQGGKSAPAAARRQHEKSKSNESGIGDSREVLAVKAEIPIDAAPALQDDERLLAQWKSDQLVEHGPARKIEHEAIPDVLPESKVDLPCGDISDQELG